MPATAAKPEVDDLLKLQPLVDDITTRYQLASKGTRVLRGRVILVVGPSPSPQRELCTFCHHGDLQVNRDASFVQHAYEDVGVLLEMVDLAKRRIAELEGKPKTEKPK